MRFFINVAFISLCLALSIGHPANATEAGDGSAILAGHAAVEAAAVRAGAAGQKAEQWDREKQVLLDEARQLIYDIEATRFAASRQEAYVATEQASIRDLSARLEAARGTRDGLDPAMEALYEELAASIAQDMPFAIDERQARLIRVRRTLDDPDASAGDKIGALLEAIRIESGYGFAMEAEDVIAHIDGSPAALSQLRVGRLALLRFPARGDFVERYDRKTGGWQRIGGVDLRELVKAVEISRKRRIADFISLPIGTIDAFPTDGGAR